jgi:hypothetical protein
MERLDPELVRARLQPAAMRLDRYFTHEPLHVVVDGFFAPKFRAVATLSALPALNDRAVRIDRRGDRLRVELLEPSVALEGSVLDDVLILESVTYPPSREAELSVLLSNVRDQLLRGGIHYVDATRTWELHREVWTHMVPRPSR